MKLLKDGMKKLQMKEKEKKTRPPLIPIYLKI